jgi:hypothetical protein
MNVIHLGSPADRLGVLIAAVPEADLERSARCSEYSVGDLLGHAAGLTVAFGGAACKAGAKFDRVFGLLGRDPAWTAP